MSDTTPLPFDKSLAKSDFFDTGNFRNCIHASNIAIHNHFASLIFKGEVKRVVYASSEFAFRERSRQLGGSQNLDLPFMNFRIRSLKNDANRPWWHAQANNRGLWIPELGRNLRYTPVTIEYDSTIFLHKDIDAMYALTELFWDDDNETTLTPKVIIPNEGTDYEVDVFGNLIYDLNGYSQYNESDWLKENKMIAHQINMSLETFILKDNTNISIPKTVILNFGHGLNIPGENPEDVYNGTIDHLNETVDWDF